jgi:hypothetical protein
VGDDFLPATITPNATIKQPTIKAGVMGSFNQKKERGAEKRDTLRARTLL